LFLADAARGGDPLAVAVARVVLARSRSAAVCAVDLSDMLVVVPGARAGRLVLDALVRCAADEGCSIDPPRIATASSLVERMATDADASHAIATELERRLAWRAAIRAAEPADRRLFLPGGSVSAEALAREEDALAATALALENELAGAGRDFEEAAAWVERSGHDAARLRMLAAWRRAALERLERIGLVAPFDARMRLVRTGSFDVRRLVLAGVFELGAQQRAMIERAAASMPVLVLVASNASRADCFDELGCPTDAWHERPAAVPDEVVVAAHAPRDQADAAIERLAELAAGPVPGPGSRRVLPCDECAFVLADPELFDPLRRAAADVGVDLHSAAGTPLAETAAGRALGALARWRRTRSPADFAALVRHPVLEHLWSRDDGSDVVAALDAVRATRLPASIDELGDGADARIVAAAVAALDERTLNRPISACLEGSAKGDGAPLGAVRELDAVRALVESIEASVDGIDASLCTGLERSELVLGEALKAAIPPEQRERSVEAIGWLELLFEPARHRIVVGMNEGRVPSASSGGLLPESAREALGLPSRRSRAARDMAVLDAALARDGSLRCIAGRIDASGDPLLPTRLLLAPQVAAGDDADDALAKRVLRFAKSDEARRGRRVRAKGGQRPARGSAFAVPAPPQAASSIAAMSVTAFRDYLACGVRFWLGRIEGLVDVEDDPEEIGLDRVGTLLHDVFRDSVQGDDLRGASEARELADRLERRFDAAVERAFGPRPMAAVPLQMRTLRRRLARFAADEVERAGAGWSIRFVEQAIPKESSIDGGVGAPMRLRGRVDRIDFHRERRAWRIIDYKTSDAGRSPRETHRAGSRPDAAWVDLQLPLYRHALAPWLESLEPGSTIELGYIRLAASDALAGWSAADFSAAEEAEAIEAARAVVRGIREGRFERGAPLGPWDPFALLLQEPVFRGGEPDGAVDGMGEES
jgi:ATP-dependent helicase/nuclease subunit B